MVSGHDDLSTLPGAPEAFEMTGLDCTIIMHPQVWKVSGHFDLFVDKMVDCTESKKRYRIDQIYGRWLNLSSHENSTSHDSNRIRRCVEAMKAKHAAHGKILDGWRFFIAVETDDSATGIAATIARACKLFEIKSKQAEELLHWESPELLKLDPNADLLHVIGADASNPGTFGTPRDFNLMFKTIVGALGTEEDAAFLRPGNSTGHIC